MLGKPPLGVVGIDKEIRFFLEVENEYPNFNDLERFVLKPAIEEVNRKTDKHTKHETKREGKQSNSPNIQDKTKTPRRY
jgi:plasmid replication initiation protein